MMKACKKCGYLFDMQESTEDLCECCAKEELSGWK